MRYKNTKAPLKRPKILQISSNPPTFGKFGLEKLEKTRWCPCKGRLLTRSGKKGLKIKGPGTI